MVAYYFFGFVGRAWVLAQARRHTSSLVFDFDLLLPNPRNKKSNSQRQR
jgi:hypothetical protein